MKNTKKEVLRNCIPAMVCMVISGLNTIIDGLFIGRNIGEDGLAAINIAWPVPGVYHCERYRYRSRMWDKLCFRTWKKT